MLLESMAQRSRQHSGTGRHYVSIRRVFHHGWSKFASLQASVPVETGVQIVVVRAVQAGPSIQTTVPGSKN